MFWLRAYAKMLVRLDREDSVKLVNAMMFAFGSMDSQVAKAYARRLNGEGDVQPRFSSPKDVARAMGIKVVSG